MGVKYCKNQSCRVELNESNTGMITKNGHRYFESYCRKCRNIRHRAWRFNNTHKRDMVLYDIYKKMSDLEKRRVKLFGRYEEKAKEQKKEVTKQCRLCGQKYPIYEFIATVAHNRWANGRIIYDTCLHCVNSRAQGKSVIIKEKKEYNRESIENYIYKKAFSKFKKELYKSGAVVIKDDKNTYIYKLTTDESCICYKNNSIEYNKSIEEIWFIYQRMLKSFYADKSKRSCTAKEMKEFFFGGLL